VPSEFHRMMRKNDDLFSAGDAPKAQPLEYASPIERGGRSRRFRPVVVVIALGAIGLLILPVLLLALQGGAVRAPRVESLSNLRQIGIAVFDYTGDYGKYPDGLVDLLDQKYISPGAFISPLDSSATPARGNTVAAMIADFNKGGHCSYVYLTMGSQLHPQRPSEVVVCYEPMSSKSGPWMNVLFADGHVDSLDANAGNAIMAECAGGVRPVRWPVAATMPGN
jgi:prepilin-type processing-associated H-X9-DG protein